MRAAIENFEAASLPHKRLWIGAMKEMGDASAQEHGDLVKLAERSNWEEILLVGEEFAQVKGNHQWFATSLEAAEYVKSNPPVGTAILIKGSRGSRMELLLEALPS
jgi:UDP-N-acetylmuramoyl-tripeptide--D-alanyl-D-alanine ligase